MAQLPDGSVVHRLADRLKPEVRRQFLAAVTQLEKRVALTALLEAIERGTSVRLDAALDQWPEDLKGLVSTLNRIFDGVAEAEQRTLARRFQIGMRFDLVNPAVVEATRSGSRLVREITQAQREMVRALIRKGLTDGIAPRELARELKQVVGLTTGQATAVQNYRASLVAAGATGSALERAVARYVAYQHRLRAENIARTETIAAGREGRHAVWRAARDQGLLPAGITKRWVVTSDDRLCPVCNEMAAQANRDQSLDGGFAAGMGTVDGPPLHPSCRCTTVLVVPRRARVAA